MKILSIDTSTRMGSVALTEDESLVVCEQQGVEGAHSERLLMSIGHILKIAGWERQAIEGIAVAVGPGSFMGLRIGLATAKGLALGLGCPVVGVSSLESLAHNCAGFDGQVLTIIDARRGELYAALWKTEPRKRPKVIIKERVASPEKVVALIKKRKGHSVIVGDGAIAYGGLFSSKLGRKAVVATGSMLYPQAGNLAAIAAESFKKGKTDDLAKLIPNYIRLSDAEIGFMGKKSGIQR